MKKPYSMPKLYAEELQLSVTAACGSGAFDIATDSQVPHSEDYQILSANSLDCAGYGPNPLDNSVGYGFHIKDGMLTACSVDNLISAGYDRDQIWEYGLTCYNIPAWEIRNFS